MTAFRDNRIPGLIYDKNADKSTFCAEGLISVSEFYRIKRVAVRRGKRRSGNKLYDAARP